MTLAEAGVDGKAARPAAYFLAFLVVLPAAFLGEAFFAGALVAFLVAITIDS
jgi:hypothetical protein